MMSFAAVHYWNFTAVVYGPDGVRFVACARRSDQLVAQIARYIAGRCDFVLWPEIAEQVRALIEAANPYAAIALYFAHVGERWDEERLELDGLSLRSLRSATAAA